MSELATIEKIDVIAVFSPAGSVDILEKIKAEARSVQRDISTDKGRKAIASLVYTIARSKTFLDEAGEKLITEQKTYINSVNTERKRCRDELDALKDEIRKPLTDYENREKNRIRTHEEALKALSLVSLYGVTSEEIKHQIGTINLLFNREWEEFKDRAVTTEASERKNLETRLEAVLKYEADKIEFERLQKEEYDRKQRERDDRLQAEAAERATKEAESKARREAEAEANRVRVEQEKAERERKRLEQEKEESERRAKKAESDRLATLKKADDDRKAALKKAEQDKVEAVQRERNRIAEENRRNAESAQKRENDQRNRKRVEDAIHDFLAEEITCDVASHVLGMLIENRIPNVRIVY